MLHVVNVKRRRDEDRTGGFDTSSYMVRYKRSRSAGGYAARKKRRAYRTRNYRTAGYVGIEKKFYDTSYSGTISADSGCASCEADPGTVNTVSAPAQGDGEQNRDGKKIVAKYLYIEGSITKLAENNLTAIPIPVGVKIAVVLDTQTNAAQLNSEDVFKNQLANAATTPQAMRDLEYGSRFRILKEYNCVLKSQLATWDGTNIEMGGDREDFQWYIPLKDLVINFNGTATAGVASVLDNSIHVIAMASIASTCNLAYNARLRFIG